MFRDIFLCSRYSILKLCTKFKKIFFFQNHSSVFPLVSLLLSSTGHNFFIPSSILTAEMGLTCLCPFDHYKTTADFNSTFHPSPLANELSSTNKTYSTQTIIHQMEPSLAFINNISDRIYSTKTKQTKISSIQKYIST